ncbi:hypothetical protein H6P81_006044 [Aristolochia fimbriata]|uniref:Integrase catalytic domain-containing protein n=1 Tax=Aristolochia fimbriata TaxID=158543 RepID=A0AAV7EW88_ARIFI|nr:hypothetical protein H6P81_006044 [Aristolochia fimbriata]
MKKSLTNHLTLKERLYTLQMAEVDGGVVMMANNSTCRAIGKGSVRLKMHDGVITTLTDVRYVPDLKRNLISLGTLDSIGCKYSAEGGAMKVSRGVLTVMKGRKIGTLYVLDGSTVTGSTTVASASLTESETTRLWHLRLGHMSESEEFNKFCEDEGTVRHRTVRHTPQQNGVAERMNRTLLERARCMLSNAGLGKEFWSEATSMACYLMNRSPSTAIECKTLEEVWSGTPAGYSDLKIFGCPAYMHDNEGKLEPRAKKCIFLGYASGVKGYRLWCTDSKSQKFFISRDVKFDESTILNAKKEPFVTPGTKEDPKSPNQVAFEIGGTSTTMNSPTTSTSLPTTSMGQSTSSSSQLPFQALHPTTSEEEEEVQFEPEAETKSYCIAKDRPRREIKKPRRYDEANLIAYALSVPETMDEAEPFSYTEAIQSENSDKWLVAMSEEMGSLHKNQTWKLVKPPFGKKVVGYKWVSKKKEGIPGVEDARYKARLVAKGYSQLPGVDFNDVFSPVVKHSSIRVVLALVAMHDLELEELDVKIAFLHGELEEQIYMHQPEGFVAEGKEDHVYLLMKSLYGLKQSSRQWYKRFEYSFMVKIGFCRSKFDNCVYFRKLVDGSFIYLLLYVDDMFIAAKEMVEIQKLKTQLKGEFEMKDLGVAKQNLGMEINKDRRGGTLYLSQRKYVEKALERLSMKNAKPVSTPFAAHFRLSLALSPQKEEDKNYMTHVPYTSAVSSLMYAMVCTRPDICHAVSVVSRYMSNPGREHWQAVKWILRYLRGTSSTCLAFKKDDFSFVGYVDSDYAGDLDRRRSITGYVFTLAGCSVSWKATLQHVYLQQKQNIWQ